MDINIFRFLAKDYIQLSNDLKDIISSYDSCEKYYCDFTETMRKPDLYGKTVRVTSKQFPIIYKLVEEISRLLEIPVPDVFIYENYYYEFEAYGIKKPWLEISASAVADMDLQELKFFLARELFKIKIGATKNYMIVEEFIKFLDKHSSMVMFSENMVESLRLKYAQWSRATQYSADNFGYYVIDDVEIASRSIMLSILNNRFLTENLNIKEYLEDCNLIDKNNDAVSVYTKYNEKVPYGQYRIKNLIKFSSLNV